VHRGGDARLRTSHLLLALAEEQGPYLRRVGANPAKVITALDRAA